MAGSRLEKLGTVFTRTRDLLRAGVVKQNKKPLWYDVYAAFPPKREPTYVGPPKREPTYVGPPKRRQKPVDNVSAIFYHEDAIRAKFYETYGNLGMFDLKRRGHKSICQRFVEKYVELQKSEVAESEDKLFEQTGKALLSEGITLRRSGAPMVSDQPPPQSKAERVASIIDQIKKSDETKKSEPTS